MKRHEKLRESFDIERPGPPWVREVRKAIDALTGWSDWQVEQTVGKWYYYFYGQSLCEYTKLTKENIAALERFLNEELP